MRKQTPAPSTQPKFDREVIRELARCFARAAVDALIEEQKQSPPIKPKPTAKRAKAEA